MDIRLVLFPVVVIPLSVVTFVAVRQAGQVQRRLLAARGWAQMSGRVIQSGVRKTPLRVRRNTDIARYRWATRYVPEVVYEYQVLGALYHGTRLQIGYSLASSDSPAAQCHADQYPASSAVTVYYRPDNPAESTLSLSAGRGMWVMWGVALMMLVVTVCVAVVVLTINA